ncbi:MAG: ABC transporter substrate-binding protein [Actinomycetota bacterium]|nr:ABC transporter substrate-binding protein [Actinomycetota bacterium]MDH5225196.1 ABC transporter substrate-binding protein [Actinomycetota bacterium]MDH5313159.1 ABC transporter substrate-binding protein [Actinomycetota bacterium]
MRARGVAAVATFALFVAACGPTGSSTEAANDDAITIASFDFDESEVVADLYAGALRLAGFDVSHVRRAGTREVVLPALERGLIEVVPEYAGSAVGFLGGEPSTDRDTTHARLRVLLGARGIETLDAAPAQSRNGLVVTSETASDLALRTISDLRAVASEMSLGGPPECPERALCLPGLEQTYGLRFARFLPLDAGGPITAEAVLRGTVDVGMLFTSDGSLTERGLVLLRDDRGLQPAENITPVVAREAVLRFGPELVDVIDTVSVALTTDELRTLNVLVRLGTSPEEAAAAWLTDNGFSRGAG